MKVLVLGATGMLGSAVFRALQTRYSVHAPARSELDADRDDPAGLLAGYDYAVNCIGVLKAGVETDIERAIRVNALFPHALGRAGKAHGCRVIHISTDAVFSGARGRYVETDLQDGSDAYARTKGLGDLAECMVLRTSVIGDELGAGSGLVSWARQNAGRQVNGFTNHAWNGMTAGEYARIVATIIAEKLHSNEVFHVFSPQDVSKHGLLVMPSHALSLNLDVRATQAPVAVDRTLRTVKALNTRLAVRDLAAQLADMG